MQLTDPTFVFLFATVLLIAITFLVRGWCCSILHHTALRGIPGPVCLPLLGTVFAFSFSELCHVGTSLLPLLRRYGDHCGGVCCIKFPTLPPVVLVSHPKDIRQVFASYSSHCGRSSMLQVRPCPCVVQHQIVLVDQFFSLFIYLQVFEPIELVMMSDFLTPWMHGRLQSHTLAPLASSFSKAMIGDVCATSLHLWCGACRMIAWLRVCVRAVNA